MKEPHSVLNITGDLYFRTVSGMWHFHFTSNLCHGFLLWGGIQRKQLDSQSAHYYLLCHRDDKWPASMGNYQRCQPAERGSPGVGRPSHHKTWPLLGTVTNIDFMSIVCDWLLSDPKLASCLWWLGYVWLLNLAPSLLSLTQRIQAGRKLACIS